MFFDIASHNRINSASLPSLLSGRNDIIVVASVSCIYGIGNPSEFKKHVIEISVEEEGMAEAEDEEFDIADMDDDGEETVDIEMGDEEGEPSDLTDVDDEEGEEEEGKIIHKDSNGNILFDGDSVVLIKDLDVKGANFTAKRGAAVHNIARATLYTQTMG